MHNIVLRYYDRQQAFGTFFLRNRPELYLIQKIMEQYSPGSHVNITVLGCSKGAEVYSVQWAVSSFQKALAINLNAVDVSPAIIDFAKKGVYSWCDRCSLINPQYCDAPLGCIEYQERSIFDRMTGEEMDIFFEFEDAHAKVRPWLKEGITWVEADAEDAALKNRIGHQDIVLANRFLCHMRPKDAERVLRAIATLVKPGGFLFVSGIDLDVRMRVAQLMNWMPIYINSIKQLYEGDDSLISGWPFEYWGIEPFSKKRKDWVVRYASLYQIPG